MKHGDSPVRYGNHQGVRFFGRGSWWDFYDGIYVRVPSGYVKIAFEHGPVEIVDFPSYKMVDLSSSFL